MTSELCSPPFPSCRQTADHSLSSSTLPGSGPPLHGPWCQVRVPKFDSPTSKFTTTGDGASLLPGSRCHFLRWAAWTELNLIAAWSFSILFSTPFFFFSKEGTVVHHAVLCQVRVCGLSSWEDQLHWPGNTTVVWTEVLAFIGENDACGISKKGNFNSVFYVTGILSM